MAENYCKAMENGQVEPREEIAALVAELGACGQSITLAAMAEFQRRLLVAERCNSEEKNRTRSVIVEYEEDMVTESLEVKKARNTLLTYLSTHGKVNKIVFSTDRMKGTEKDIPAGCNVLVVEGEENVMEVKRDFPSLMSKGENGAN